jgi:CobQ-like glutamine amidotransferase family enzyme
MTEKTLNIGWLYPDLMSTYGDRGNIIAFQKRCEWRGIKTNLSTINQETKISDLEKLDFIFGGGAQDLEQEIVIKDLQGKKGETIKNLIENGLPALFVCGAPQLMGRYYEPAVGKRIEGLGVFDITTIHPGPNQSRLIGNIIAKVELEGFSTTIVGFENHGGRTQLGKTAKPFAYVIKGFGNNGEDQTEGVIYKYAIGCYFHGPLLPKNPTIADWLIAKSLGKKYKEKVELKSLDDSLENQAHSVIATRLGVGV